jgi:hypothetical protein
MGRYLELAHQVTEPAAPWDETTADHLLLDALGRVALRFKPGWLIRLGEESRNWLPVEAAIETAALTRDMTVFIRAVAAYEQFALTRFEAWEREDMVRQ